MRSLKFLVPLVLFTPGLAFAQASKVESGILKAVNPMVGIGMAVATLMLIKVGMAYASGDPSAKEDSKGVLIGAILILSASTIAGLMKAWFA